MSSLLLETHAGVPKKHATERLCYLKYIRFVLRVRLGLGGRCKSEQTQKLYILSLNISPIKMQHQINLKQK